MRVSREVRRYHHAGVVAALLGRGDPGVVVTDAQRIRREQARGVHPLPEADPERRDAACTRHGRPATPGRPHAWEKPAPGRAAVLCAPCGSLCRPCAEPFARQAVAVVPKWARNARAKPAADMKPWSSATASTLWSAWWISATAARSRRSRWTKAASVSPVTARKTRWKWKGERCPMRARRSSGRSSARWSRTWSMTSFTRCSYSARAAPEVILFQPSRARGDRLARRASSTCPCSGSCRRGTRRCRSPGSSGPRRRRPCP